MKYQQQQGTDLVSAQKRKSVRRDDLLRIPGAMGIHRTNLTNPDRWNEVARGELSYEPDRALVAMVRDVCRTARTKCTLAQQQAVRRAVTLYCTVTLLDEMLEPLGPVSNEGNMVELFQEAEKEQTEAICAEAVDLQAPSPTNDERAAREFEEAAIADKRMAESLKQRAMKAWQRATS